MRSNTALLSGALLTAFSAAMPALADELPDAPIATAPAGADAPTLPLLPEPVAEVPPSPWGQGPWLHTSIAKPEGCYQTETVGLETGHRVPYQRIVMQPGRAVSENSFEQGCAALRGYLSYQFNASALISGNNGKSQHEMVDELSLKFSYAREFRVKGVRVDATMFAGYRAIDGPRGLQNGNDDYSDLGIEVGLPMQFDRLYVRPSCMDVKENPINYVNSLNAIFCQVTFRYSFRTMDIIVTPGSRRQQNSSGAVDVIPGANDAKSAEFLDAAVRWRLPYRFALTVGVRWDQFESRNTKYDRCVARDDRIYYCGSAGSAPAASPLGDPFIQISRHITY